VEYRSPCCVGKNPSDFRPTVEGAIGHALVERERGRFAPFFCFMRKLLTRLPPKSHVYLKEEINMPDAKNSFLKGLVITLAVVVVIAIVGAWFLLARFNSMSRDAHRQDKTDRSGLAMATITLKQDIVALKSQEVGVAARTWGTYKLGLQAERKGDQELAKENYAAAGIAYLEALGNFKNALAASREDSAAVALRQTNLNVGGLQTQTRGRNEPAAETTIKAKASALYEQVLRDERDRQAKAENEKARESRADFRRNRGNFGKAQAEYRIQLCLFKPGSFPRAVDKRHSLCLHASRRDERRHFGRKPERKRRD